MDYLYNLSINLMGNKINHAFDHISSINRRHDPHNQHYQPCTCPICFQQFDGPNAEKNVQKHIDKCLSRPPKNTNQMFIDRNQYPPNNPYFNVVACPICDQVFTGPEAERVAAEHVESCLVTSDVRDSQQITEHPYKNILNNGIAQKAYCHTCSQSFAGPDAERIAKQHSEKCLIVRSAYTEQKIVKLKKNSAKFNRLRENFDSIRMD